MTKLRVHIIKANGTRFESIWGENTPDSKILAGLNANKVIYGYNNTITKIDPVTKMPIQVDDVTSGWALDNKDTVVAVVDDEGKELRRLKGVKLSVVPETTEQTKVG